MRPARCWNGSRPTGPRARCIKVEAGEGWQAWFDGAAAPNPGRIGLGVLLLSPGGVRQELSLRPGQLGCNNEAELLALAEVLDLAWAAGARRLTVRGDSDFAVRHLQGQAHTAVPHLAELLQTVLAKAARFEAVQFLWVPRHRNGEADRLSRQALGLTTEPVQRPISKRRR